MACADCSPTHAMADRVDAWKTARALLNDGKWPEDDQPGPTTVLIVASFLLGEEVMEP